jgi:hypothetical protein
VAESDKPDGENAPGDGVDDETFARAVGLTSDDERRRGLRGKKKFGSDEIEAQDPAERRERAVVRRPPARQRNRDAGNEQLEPVDTTGVVPLVDAPEPPVESVSALTDQPTVYRPILPSAPLELDNQVVPDEGDLGWLRRRRARVRRTRRTIRHIDPWSVLKVSVVLYACLYGATVLAGYLLWTAAVQSGVISNIESFIAEVGSYEIWEINGEEIFRRATVIGAVLFVAGIALNVLLTIVFNLISDLVGGVRVTLLEEDQPPSHGN